MGVKKVVFIGGCWDLFHIGHLNILQRAAAMGDTLVVGVNADELVEREKGMKPAISFEHRYRIIEALKCVDIVIKQTVKTDIGQLKEYKVNIVVVGEDWEGKYVEGLEWMKKHGEVVYLPRTGGISSTEIKQRLNKGKW